METMTEEQRALVEQTVSLVRKLRAVKAPVDDLAEIEGALDFALIEDDMMTEEQRALVEQTVSLVRKLRATKVPVDALAQMEGALDFALIKDDMTRWTPQQWAEVFPGS